MLVGLEQRLLGAGQVAAAQPDGPELDQGPAELAPSLSLARLFVPERELECEIIEGEDDEDAGRRLALRLREEGLI